jgi:glutathione synthase/RimK-type ligase-like ATP-grasp enzyme
MSLTVSGDQRPAIVFVTYSADPAITPDDRLAADLLEADGLTVVGAPWNDHSIDWPRYASVVIRSTWDYHLAPAAFEAWLRARAADGTNLWNPPAAVLGNTNKRYLAALEARGVDVVPTEHVPAGSGQPLGGLLARRGWREAVVKPAVSASAHGTWRTSMAAASADERRFAADAAAHDLLVQPLLPEVAAEGEWSLIFLGGRFSHAAIKQPAPGDFRVQWEFGGTTRPATPGPDLIEQAGAVVDAVGTPLLYARVDGVRRAGGFSLMELEITEPHLFLDHDPAAPRRFAAAIVERCR